jgi:hypothetical protein
MIFFQFSLGVQNTMKMPFLHNNVFLTSRAKEFLMLTSNFVPGEIIPEDKIIPLLSWHPWRITKSTNGKFMVDKGPFYNISSDTIGILSKIPQLHLCCVEDCLVAIAFAPYLNFNRNIEYEIDYLYDLIIYEKAILSI